MTTHGLSKTKEYECWKAMKARCNNPNHKNFDYYTGKGIKVSKDWLYSFETFIEDVGFQPKDGGRYTLDRIDPDKGYQKGNVRWASQKQQCHNIKNHSRNKTGVVGVTKRKNGDWVATWRNPDGKAKSKQFSVRKYGEELAFFAACECREQMIETLNRIGEGYSEYHITKLYEGDI